MHGRKYIRGIFVLFVTVCAMFSTDRSVLAGPKARGVPAAATKKVSLGESQTISQPFVIKAASRTLEERGRAALGMLGFDYEDAFPGWTIAFLPGRERLLGLTVVGDRRVEIFIRKDRPVAGLAHDIAHEFGHIVDVTYNNDRIRSLFLDLRKLPASSAWWACNSCRDLEVGAGDFAEVFAYIVAPRFAFYSRLKGTPDAQLADAIRTQVLPKAIRFYGGTNEPVAPTEVPVAKTEAPGPTAG